MASSDLMFTPAGDLAARVRGGELSARELVQASLDRIAAQGVELPSLMARRVAVGTGGWRYCLDHD